MIDDLHFLRLWDLYAPILTATQREITDLYFNYDLSLAEIAEQKGVSRQSVSDCLNTCRKQLEAYEQKLGFAKGIFDLSKEYSAYMTTVRCWLDEQKCARPELKETWLDLENKLVATLREFGVEQMDLDGERSVFGRTFREK